MAKIYSLKAELHVHSNHGRRLPYAPFLYDAVQTEEEIISECLRKNIKILSITDHDSLKGSMNAREIIKRRGLDILLVPGCEITSQDGHILAYNINREIPAFKPAGEVIKMIHDQGGLAVAAHPYNFVMGVGDKVRELDFDAMEVFNSAIPQRSNMKAIKVSQEIGKPGTAGSDAHLPKNIGLGSVEFSQEVNTTEIFLASLLSGDFRLETRRNNFVLDLPEYLGKNIWVQSSELLEMLQ